MNSIKPTKGQLAKLKLRYGVGTGVMMYVTDEGEVTYGDFCVGRDGQMRNIVDGRPLDLKHLVEKRYGTAEGSATSRAGQDIYIDAIVAPMGTMFQPRGSVRRFANMGEAITYVKTSDYFAVRREK